jgi:Acetyltransferase (GNAT) domain
MASNQLLQLDPLSDGWLEFVGSFPQANIFHHPAWVKLLSDCYRYPAFALALGDDENSIIAGLPFLDVNSYLTGRRLVSLPFTDYCQPMYRDEDALNTLLSGLLDYQKEKLSPLIEVRWELPSDPNIVKISPFVQHVVNLDQDLESISKALHRTQRQNIKTAEKNGIEIRKGENIDSLKVFFHLHCLTRRRQGVPVQPWRFFILILERMIAKGNGYILQAYKGDRCLAAGLFLHWNQTLSYKYAASDDIDQDLRPNHLITWEAMRWGCENGYKAFDFGRTDINNEGLRTFKCRWGATETPLYYSVFSKMVKQPSNHKLNSVMNMVLRNSPPWVSRIVGEIFYKHFG